MFNRRQFVAGAIALPITATTANAQSGTPVATPMTAAPPSTPDVLPAWLDAQAELTRLGEEAVAAFWNADVDTLAEMGTPELAAAFQLDSGIQEELDKFTADQIQFAFHEVGAWFFGQYSPEKLSGTFIQGSALPWEAIPDDPQSGDVPSGTWTGAIGPGIIDLEISLQFEGDADTLRVTLSIPSQFLMNAPMEDVVFASEIPIGEKRDTRVVPAGGDVTILNNYAEQYAWGDHTLSLDSYWTGDGLLAGITILPQASLPEAPAQTPIPARLPFDGAWLVVWGGETQFQNYHAAHGSQRFAADILLWREGSTANAPGTDSEHYHAFGQPYLAPVSGKVVAALDGLDDIAPQQPGNPEDHAAGNHIVIETEGGFVFLAHCKNGSIVVAQGDSVEAGDEIAAIGNSGNTSEPHVHIHAQTTNDLYDPAAVGIPLIFENVLVNGEAQDTATPLHGTIMEQRI